MAEWKNTIGHKRKILDRKYNTEWTHGRARQILFESFDQILFESFDQILFKKFIFLNKFAILIPNGICPQTAQKIGRSA
jgi:hypothetical protein